MAFLFLLGRKAIFLPQAEVASLRGGYKCTGPFISFLVAVNRKALINLHLNAI